MIVLIGQKGKPEENIVFLLERIRRLEGTADDAKLVCVTTTDREYL